MQELNHPGELTDTPKGLTMQTCWQGYRFRSRLEAKWAVFFDCLGVRWEYEPECYVLPSGPYLPDFFINEWRAFFEIKPWIEAYEAPRHAARLAELRIVSGALAAYVIFGPPDLVRGAIIADDTGGNWASHITEHGPANIIPRAEGPAYRAYIRAMRERFEKR